MTVVLGFKCSKDALEWAVVDGQDRGSARVLDSNKASIPSDSSRGFELVWVRNEVLELVARWSPASAVVQATESRGPIVQPARAEVDGVVQEALASTGLTVTRLLTTGLYGKFGVRKKEEFTAATASLSAVTQTPKARHGSLLAALSLLPPADE